MHFEILETDGLARIAKIEVNGKNLITPNLFAVVKPSGNLITPYELKRLGVDCIFTNAYILYQNEILKERALRNGIHKLLDYDGIIATDSGAFQQYMYNDKIDINPEDIELFQENIGSDFPVILDIPVQPNDTYEVAKNKVLKTIERAKENIKRRKYTKSEWMGPIHGGKYKDLLEMSAKEMSKLDFGIYAIGGLVKFFIDYRFDLVVDILLTVKNNIIPNRPLHMFGLGLPQFFSLAIACGCDFMDSAAFMLYAKDERYFTLSTGTKKLGELEEFPCDCPVCFNFTPKELMTFNKKLRTELLAKHNLQVSYSELKTIRQAIREGKLWELVEIRTRSHPSLIRGLNILKKYSGFIEKYEKRYKKGGLFYISSETLNRPIITRLIKYIKNTYIVPESVKYVIILPELDVNRETSPIIKKWLNFIENFKGINRKLIHVIFMTTLFGTVPLELSDSYPFGQNESIAFPDQSSELYKKSVRDSVDFFKNYAKFYQKCGILVPKSYYNQFNEKKEFISHPIEDLKPYLENNFHNNLIESDSLEEILIFFIEN